MIIAPITPSSLLNRRLHDILSVLYKAISSFSSSCPFHKSLLLCFIFFSIFVSFIFYHDWSHFYKPQISFWVHVKCMFKNVDLTWDDLIIEFTFDFPWIVFKVCLILPSNIYSISKNICFLEPNILTKTVRHNKYCKKSL